MTRKLKKMLKRIIAASVLFIVINAGSVIYKKISGNAFNELAFGIPLLVLSVINYLVIGYDILKKAGKGIIHGQVFDENFLMAVASLGAFALAIYEKSGNYNEAVAVMLFYQVGEFFQSAAVGKSRKNITELMDIRPDYANIEKDGKLIQVNPDEVETGSIIVVQPGEKVPLDGEVIEGKASLNTSALTGESQPREVSAGDQIISGCVNLSGLLKIKTTKAFGESTVSKILELVENSTSRKSKSEAFISKFAKIYTPFVCASALVLAILPPLVSLIFLKINPEWAKWIHRALTFLVISCPCALVISIPLSFFAGIGGASHEGILVKGSNYLETLSKVNIVVFDKTGTLTEGVFEVDVMHNHECAEIAEEERLKLIEYAALAESSSNHPISKSLQKAYGKEIDRTRVTEVEEISGNGIKAKVDGISVACGNSKLMQKMKLDVQPCKCTGTVIHVAIDGKYAGHIIISDKIKKNSPQAITSLKKNGISKTIMLTGDSKKVADQVATKLKIDEVYSELLPADKVAHVEDFINQKKMNEKLAFVGDGINDAPVIASADIGIAMGGVGSDSAIEASGVVIMTDDISKIPQSIEIARKTMKIAKQNIAFALSVKVLAMVLGALGLAGMEMAIFADVGVALLAVLNSMRASRT